MKFVAEIQKSRERVKERNLASKTVLKFRGSERQFEDSDSVRYVFCFAHLHYSQ